MQKYFLGDLILYMIKLTPPKITPYYLNENRKLCNIVAQNKNFGALHLETDRYQDISERYITKLKDKNDNILGYEIFSFEDFSNSLFGYSIRVNPNLRQKGLHLGELLRLSSIIEMLENNAEKLKIYSKDTAIYFHSKYKFQPSIDSFKDRDKALESIVKNPKNGMEPFIDSAKKLIEKIKNSRTPEEQRATIPQANEITKEYIEEVLSSPKGYKEYPFEYGMGMDLTKDTVIKNKYFYNELFHKHGIDYEI